MNRLQAFRLLLLSFLLILTGCAPKQPLPIETKTAQEASAYQKLSMIEAVKNGDLKSVGRYLKAQVPADLTDSDGTPLLLLSVTYGHYSVTQLLLEHQASVDAAEPKEGMTPLLTAIKKGDLKMVQILLDHGASLSVQDRSGKSALAMAMYSDTPDLVKFLILQGADSSYKDTNGATLLHLAAQNEAVKTLAYLIKQKLSLDAKDLKGLTPLHYALKHGRAKAAAFLLKKSRPKASQQQFSLWQAAIQSRDSALLQTLLDAGIDINVRDEKSGDTVLLEALKSVAIEPLIEFILTHSKQATMINKARVTPLEYAKKHELQSYIAIIKPYYLKDTIKKLIAADNFEALKALKLQYSGITDLITDVKYKLLLDGPDTLMIGDIYRLGRKGRASEILVAQIKSLQGGYKRLSSEDIDILQALKVSPKVIAAILYKSAYLRLSSEQQAKEEASKEKVENFLSYMEYILTEQRKEIQTLKQAQNLLEEILLKLDEVLQEQVQTRSMILHAQELSKENQLMMQPAKK